MKLNSLIIHILDRFRTFKKVSDWSLVGRDSAQHSENIKSRSLELAVVLDNGHEAVCDDCNINLYPHSILSGSPKGKNSEVLLYPPEEKFNLVEHCDILSLDCKVFGKECEHPLLLGWVLLLGHRAFKPYGLVKQNVIVPVQQILSRYDFIFEMLFRSDDEHRTDALNPVQSGKVVISKI